MSDQCSSKSSILEEQISMMPGDSVENLDTKNLSPDVVTEKKEEEALIEKVNKLELALKKDDLSTTGAVVHNQLSDCLSYLQDYNSDDSSDSENEEIQEAQFHRVDVENYVSDSDLSEYDSLDDLFEDGTPSEKPKTSKKEDRISWTADLGMNTSNVKIPDISSLELNNKEEFLHIGNVDCIVDKFVTIEGLPAVPAYDLDTLLFLEEGSKVLGYVFDVMGPVASPIYIVHLNSLEMVTNLQLKRGTKIYSAPKSKYTKYVFVHELMKIRGSDASWVGDAELPHEFQEFSDDEMERQSKNTKKVAKRKQGSLERHHEFETNMNKINQLNSRLHNMLDNHKTPGQRTKAPKPRNDHQKKTARASFPGGAPPRWSNGPPPAPHRQTAELSLDGSRNLQVYLQNCTLQFMQNWRTHPANFSRLPPPQPLHPSEQYYNPTSVPCPAPVFDPSVPPPNYGVQLGSYSPPDASGSSLPSVNLAGNSTISTITSNHTVRPPNEPGPSNGI